MNTVKKIIVFPLILTLMWSSLIFAADILELKHRDDVHVSDFDGITFRLSKDNINIKEILDDVKFIDIKFIDHLRIIIFIKHVKNGETQELIESLKTRFPPSHFSRSSYGLGEHSLIVEIFSKKAEYHGSSHYHFSSKSIKQKVVMLDVGSPHIWIEKRIVWFFKNTSISKMRKLASDIKRSQANPNRVQIAIWLIGKRKGMIELDWPVQVRRDE